MKCNLCGANIGLLRKGFALSNGAVCFKCFEELGFDRNDAAQYADATWEEIASGYGAYMKRKNDKQVADDIMNMFQFAHYGEKRDVNATDEECQVFDILCSLLKDKGAPEQLELVRKSNDYVAAAIGDYDLVRMKYTARAKWVMFPYTDSGTTKHYITSPSDVAGYGELIDTALAWIRKYNGK